MDKTDLFVTNELDWLLLIAELSWNPWVYYKEARC